jgi:hypothetical protein
VQERIDVAGAIGAWSTSRAAGNNASLEQFIPNWGRQHEAQPVEQMIAVLRGLQRKGKRGES